MSKSYLTKVRQEELKNELDNLKSAGRSEVAARLKQAKELGDLSENSDYQEAREAQSILERRIQEVEEVLRNSVLIEKTRVGDTIRVGSTVCLKKGKDKINYTIVGSQEARPAEGFISNLSPIGRSLIGKEVGDAVQIDTPKGAVSYEILGIE